MARIDNIKVLRTKFQTIVYVDFSDGRFGTHTYADGKWITKRMTVEELAEAARLAKKNGKWMNWKAPRGR